MESFGLTSSCPSFSGSESVSSPPSPSLLYLRPRVLVTAGVAALALLVLDTLEGPVARTSGRRRLRTSFCLPRSSDPLSSARAES